MGNWSHTDNMDAMLNNIKSNSNLLLMCSAQPVDYTQATTLHDGTAGKYKLAEVVISTANFTGPTTGDISGRKLVVLQSNGVEALASDNGNHIALCDTINQKLLYVAQCVAQEITIGNLIDFPSFTIEVSDPTQSV